mmetsp:Transcript_39347/g.83860  ORF Transcript_39347/g.83860 Transcript_39347/m.83860 type:complete len:255 (+) Transcript_39347:1455-2219(+)
MVSTFVSAARALPLLRSFPGRAFSRRLSWSTVSFRPFAVFDSWKKLGVESLVSSPSFLLSAGLTGTDFIFEVLVFRKLMSAATSSEAFLSFSSTSAHASFAASSDVISDLVWNSLNSVENDSEADCAAVTFSENSLSSFRASSRSSSFFLANSSFCCANFSRCVSTFFAFSLAAATALSCSSWTVDWREPQFMNSVPIVTVKSSRSFSRVSGVTPCSFLMSFLIVATAAASACLTSLSFLTSSCLALAASIFFC